MPEENSNDLEAPQPEAVEAENSKIAEIKEGQRALVEAPRKKSSIKKPKDPLIAALSVNKHFWSKKRKGWATDIY
jgi:hypothetical protein